MKLGVFTVLFGNEPFEAALDRAADAGLSPRRVRDRELSGRCPLPSRGASGRPGAPRVVRPGRIEPGLESLGANFDPSHLFWQWIDIETAIAELGREGAIFHTHAKDTAIHPRNAALNGVLDTVPLADVAKRSWIFRTVGYGHGEPDWRRILSALHLAGYDHVLSIEHDDALLSIDEWFRNGVAFLRSVMPSEPAMTATWWT